MCFGAVTFKCPYILQRNVKKMKCSTNQQLNIFKQINRFLLSGVFKFINMMTDLKITCSILKIILSYVICLHRIYLHKIFEKAKLSKLLTPVKVWYSYCGATSFFCFSFLQSLSLMRVSMLIFLTFSDLSFIIIMTDMSQWEES